MRVTRPAEAARAARQALPEKFYATPGQVVAAELAERQKPFSGPMDSRRIGQGAAREVRTQIGGLAALPAVKPLPTSV